MDLSLMMKLLFIFTIISAVVSCVAVYFSRDNLLSPSELKAVRRSQTQNNKGAIPDIQHEPSYDESVLPSGEKELADKTGTVERSHYLPHALIIGVKKCGTGALQTFLDIHPGISTLTVENFPHESLPSAEAWRNLAPLSTKNQISIVNFPGFIHVPAMISSLMEKLIPNMKLLLIVRDPIKRAVSDYVHVNSVIDRIETGKERSLPFTYRFEEKVLANGSSIKQKVISFRNYEVYPTFEETVMQKNSNKLNISNKFVTMGLYANEVTELLKYFSRDKILVIDGEKFSSNPLQYLKKVEQFLGLKPFFKPNHFYFDSKKGFICSRVPERPDVKCMGRDKGRAHPTVKPYVLNKMRQFYHPYNMKLQKQFGENFSWINNSDINV